MNRPKFITLNLASNHRKVRINPAFIVSIHDGSCHREAVIDLSNGKSETVAHSAHDVHVLTEQIYEEINPSFKH